MHVRGFFFLYVDFCAAFLFCLLFKHVRVSTACNAAQIMCILMQICCCHMHMQLCCCERCPLMPPSQRFKAIYEVHNALVCISYFCTYCNKYVYAHVNVYIYIIVVIVLNILDTDNGKVSMACCTYPLEFSPCTRPTARITYIGCMRSVKPMEPPLEPYRRNNVQRLALFQYGV